MHPFATRGAEHHLHDRAKADFNGAWDYWHTVTAEELPADEVTALGSVT